VRASFLAYPNKAPDGSGPPGRPCRGAARRRPRAREHATAGGRSAASPAPAPTHRDHHSLLFLSLGAASAGSLFFLDLVFSSCVHVLRTRQGDGLIKETQVKIRSSHVPRLATCPPPGIVSDPSPPQLRCASLNLVGSGVLRCRDFLGFRCHRSTRRHGPAGGRGRYGLGFSLRPRDTSGAGRASPSPSRPARNPQPCLGRGTGHGRLGDAAAAAAGRWRYPYRPIYYHHSTDKLIPLSGGWATNTVVLPPYRNPTWISRGQEILEGALLGPVWEGF